MKNFMSLFALVALLFGSQSFAAVERKFLDLKLPSQQMVEKQTVTNPAAAGASNILSGHAGNASAAAVVVTSFVAQPDVPRSLVLTPGGTTADTANCNVAVAGTDILGQAISENLFVGNNQAGVTTGALAFRTITSVTFPANCEDGSFGATWSLGYGEKIGVKRCMDAAGHILFSTLNGAKEATAPTMSVGTGASVAGVTADYVGTMNGSNDFELFFIQNFRCKP